MILVIGSGVSSLAFARRCRSDGVKFKIYEKDERIGGKAKTYTSPCGNARFDFAGHFLHYPGEVPVVAGAKFDLPVRTRKAKVLFDGQILDYPIQQSIKEKSITIGDAPKWDTYPEGSMTNFFVEKFGELAWHFFIPYNRKVWAVSTDMLEQDHYEKFRSPVKGHGYNDKFMYSDSGSHAVVDTIEESIRAEIDMFTLTEVESIDPVEKVAVVFDRVDETRRVVSYSKLISPMPLPDLCRMTTGFESMANELRWSSVIIFNIAYIGRPARKEMTDVSWLYVGTHKHRFFRCGWYSHVAPGMSKPGYESMYVEVSYPGELDDRISVRDVQAEVLEDLVDIGILESIVQISSVDTIVVKKAYPLSVNNKSRRVEIIRDAFECSDIYPVGRYGLWRWTGMFEDMSYSDRLYDYMFNNGDRPKIFGE